MKVRNKFYSILFVLILFSRCTLIEDALQETGDEVTTPANLTEIRCRDISDSASIITNASLYAGQNMQIQATGYYSDGSSADLTAKVAWSYSSANVISIDSTGLLLATAVGQTTVSASYQGVNSSSATVNVLANGNIFENQTQNGEFFKETMSYGSSLLFSVSSASLDSTLYSSNGQPNQSVQIGSYRSLEKISTALVVGNFIVLLPRYAEGDPTLWAIPLPGGYNITALQSNLANHFYFVANGNELYQSDATAAGTTLLFTFATADVRTGAYYNGNVYVIGQDAANLLVENLSNNTVTTIRNLTSTEPVTGGAQTTFAFQFTYFTLGENMNLIPVTGGMLVFITGTDNLVNMLERTERWFIDGAGAATLLDSGTRDLWHDPETWKFQQIAGQNYVTQCIWDVCTAYSYNGTLVSIAFQSGVDFALGCQLLLSAAAQSDFSASASNTTGCYDMGGNILIGVKQNGLWVTNNLAGGGNIVFPDDNVMIDGVLLSQGVYYLFTGNGDWLQLYPY